MTKTSYINWLKQVNKLKPKKRKIIMKEMKKIWMITMMAIVLTIGSCSKEKDLEPKSTLGMGHRYGDVYNDPSYKRISMETYVPTGWYADTVLINGDYIYTQSGNIFASHGPCNNGVGPQYDISVKSGDIITYNIHCGVSQFNLWTLIHDSNNNIIYGDNKNNAYEKKLTYRIP